MAYCTKNWYVTQNIDLIQIYNFYLKVSFLNCVYLTKHNVKITYPSTTDMSLYIKHFYQSQSEAQNENEKK
jgi:hypothetical protein